jgi:hypothetical protein
MPSENIIDASKKSERAFVLGLFDLSVAANEPHLDRKVLEAKYKFTRSRSNVICLYWLKSGLVEGDKFGIVHLTSAGIAAVREYKRRKGT